MSSENITDREISDYLLGEIGAARTELIEELTVSDEAFGDRVNAVERDLLDAYVAQEMQPDERSRFESHYFASPIRRDKVRFAESLKAFAAGTQVRASPAGVTESIGFSAALRGYIFSWRGALRLSFAALALIAATGVWWLFGRATVGVPSDLAQSQPANAAVAPEPKPTSETPDPGNKAGEQVEPGPSVPSQNKPDRNQPPVRPSDPAPKVYAFALPPPVRGSQVRSVSLPADADRVAASLELELNDFAAYEVALYGESPGRPVWRSGKIRAGRSGDGSRLNVSVPKRFFKPQIYRFTVTGTGASGSEIVGDYPFRVVQ